MSEINKCLNCEKDDNLVPLLSIKFSSKASWICTECFPIFVHKPEKVADKLNKLKEDKK